MDREEAQASSTWRVVTTNSTIRGEVLPSGIRNDSGFVCTFSIPTHYSGQDARYKQECAELRKCAEIMCAALIKADVSKLLAKAYEKRKYERRKRKKIENRKRGLRAGKKMYACSQCDGLGHNRLTCPDQD